MVIGPSVSVVQYLYFRRPKCGTFIAAFRSSRLTAEDHMERKPGLGRLKYDKARRTIVRVRPTIKQRLSRWWWEIRNLLSYKN